MKKRALLVMMTLGISAMLVMFFVLASIPSSVRADGLVFYVVVGGTGTACTKSAPCGSIQAAIDLAGDGDAVWVASGTYVENLTVARSISLLGGWDIAFTVQDAETQPTIVEDAGSVDHNLRVGESDTSLVADITVEGFTFRNGNDGIHVWSSNNSGSLSVMHVSVQNVSGQGIEVDGGLVHITASQIMTAQRGVEVDAGVVQAETLEVQYTTEEGFILEAGGVVTITRCAFRDIGQQGIQVNRGTALIAESTVTGVMSEAIFIKGGTVILDHNVISNVISNGNPGIYAEPDGDVALNLTVVGNRVYAVPDHGIYARATKGTFEDNTVYDVEGNGLYVREGDAHIVGNTVYNAQDRGIYVRDEDTLLAEDAYIVNNLVHDVANVGIEVRGCDATIIGNTVHTGGDRGIDARGGKATIAQNTVYNTVSDGIRTRLDSTDTDIRENTVYAITGDDGIDARGVRVWVRGNHVTGNADNGIKVEEISEWVQILANQVLSNSQLGIVVREGPAFTLTNNIVGDNLEGAVQVAGDGEGVIYHNTLVGSGMGQQGVGLAALETVNLTIVNNIVVSHTIGITLTPTTTADVRQLLLWGNADNPIISGSITIYQPFPALFVDPVRQDYHSLLESPAIDRGEDVGVMVDIDGEVRPFGPYPDVGADEVLHYSFIYLPLVLRNHPPPIVQSEPSAYYLYADSADLAKLESNPYSDDTIPATFVTERGWSVDLRYRGDTARTMPKKSWKVYFPDSDPFVLSSQDGTFWELNLNADYIDQTLLRSAVAYDFLVRVGVPTPKATYARLNLNGWYYGLFSQVEQIDERFLYRHDFNIHGNLYKPFYGSLKLPSGDVNEDWWDYHYPKKTNRDSGREDLWQLMEIIAYTPDEAFAETIGPVLDVNGWLDWYAANILLGNFEMLEKNYYLYHDFSTGRWHILPWDVDLSLGHNAMFAVPDPLLDYDVTWDNPIDSGTQNSRKIDGKWNALIDRMMRVPEFRYFHGRRLIEIMENEFSVGVMSDYIDSFYEAVAVYGEADHNRWRAGDFPFSAGSDELMWYITNRRTWLYMHLPDFMPDLHPPIVLNEMMANNASTLRDEAGDYDPWIELYNASAALTWDLSGMYLSDDDNNQPKWRIPDGTEILPQGTLVIWVDGEPREGPLHTNFALTTTGGTLDMWDRALFGNAPIFRAIYVTQTLDVAYGLFSDGSGELQPLSAPTPGWRNVGRPPAVTGTAHTPAWPTAGVFVTVTSHIADEGIVTPTVWYRTGLPLSEPTAYLPVTMSQMGQTSEWRAAFPPQSNITRVEYYVEVYDTAGMCAVDRPGWPAEDYHYIVGWQPPALVINEVMARNTRIENENGGTSDWIELYNPGSVAVDLGGMFLTDDPALPNRYEIPAGISAPAGGYVLFWADGGSSGNHLNFKLAGEGEAVALFDRLDRGMGRIDVTFFDPQELDVSWGRYPDGGVTWDAIDTPTPGSPNRLRPPAFVRVTRAPHWPTASDNVEVTAVISAGQPISSAALWVDLGDGFHPVSMSGVMTYSAALTYSAHIPAQAESALVSYYIEAIDVLGQRTVYPEGAPVAAERYIVGYVPPPVAINEFLASNTTINQDEAGEYEDWIELYNTGTESVSLDGFYLTDHLDNPAKWRFPPGTVIAPGAYLLVWCDSQPTQGPLHADFKLSRDGEAIGLFDTDARNNIAVDTLTFGRQNPDVSYGRYPDGANVWTFFDLPTPGDSNE